MSEHAHENPNYIKIWAILVVLLGISVLGPLFGHPVVTLVTAFGIALVKAYLVAKNFMHVNVQKRFVAYMLLTCLVFMALFFFAAAPDVMKAEGDNWYKPEAQWQAGAGTSEGHGDH
jgi:caa(3)-type oxidase subunit IV